MYIFWVLHWLDLISLTKAIAILRNGHGSTAESIYQILMQIWPKSSTLASLLAGYLRQFWSNLCPNMQSRLASMTDVQKTHDRHL